MRLAPLLLLLTGCGGGGGAGEPDAGPTHPPYPALNPHANVVLSDVQLVTINFPGYTYASQLEDFGEAIVSSDWFKTVGQDYGVHPGTQVTTWTLANPPNDSYTNSQIGMLIDAEITAGHLPPPAVTNDQVLYILYMPPGATPRVPDFSNDYGYHSVGSHGGIAFPYAVILDDGLGGLAEVTDTASHEILEGCSDPFNAPHDGFYLDVSPDDPFFLASGQEAADLCDDEDPILSGSYVVQRIYSSTAAQAGGAPCVPLLPDDSWQAVYATPARMPHVAAGATVTIQLTGWSVGATTGDWTLAIGDASDPHGFSDFTPTEMNAILSSTSMNDGVVVTLTLTVPAAARANNYGGVFIWSGPKKRMWPVGFAVE